MAIALHAGVGTRTARAGASRVGRTWNEVLTDIYADYYDRLMGYFVNRTHDRMLAEDLTHDTIVRFARSCDNFDASRPAWPYLMTTANNVMIDHWRRAEREVDLDVEEELESDECLVPTPHDQIVLRSILDEAMNRLPDRQRIAVDLRYERGWSVIDAAEFLGVSPGTLGQLLFRARQTMKEYMEGVSTRVHGLVLPVLLALRWRWRTWTAKGREFAQTPVTAMSMEALAGVVVATGIGLTVITGPISAAEPSSDAAYPIEEDASDASLLITDSVDPEPEGGLGGLSAEPTQTTTQGDDPNLDPVPRERLRVGAALTDDSQSGVVVQEDDARFSTSSTVEARTGVVVLAEGDDVSFSCGAAVLGELCGID